MNVCPAEFVKLTDFVSPLSSVTVPETPKIVTPDFMFPAIILLSILDVTALTLTSLKPFMGLVGVIVCAEVVGVTDKLSALSSTTSPVTPRIVTPSLILFAVIFSSISFVTGLTVTSSKPV